MHTYLYGFDDDDDVYDVHTPSVCVANVTHQLLQQLVKLRLPVQPPPPQLSLLSTEKTRCNITKCWELLENEMIWNMKDNTLGQE